MIDINLILQLTEKHLYIVKWFGYYDSKEFHKYHTTIETNNGWNYFIQVEFKIPLNSFTEVEGYLKVLELQKHIDKNKGCLCTNIELNKNIALKLHKAIKENIQKQHKIFNDNLKDLLKEN